MGRAWVYEGTIHGRPRSPANGRSEIQRQNARIERALAHVLDDLQRSAGQVEREPTEDLVAAFRAHRAMLNSAKLLGELRDGLAAELVDGEEIVQRVFWR